MLKDEFQFYLDNQSELLKQCKGRFVVIIGNKVVGASREYKQQLSDDMAYIRAHSNFALFGTNAI